MKMIWKKALSAPPPGGPIAPSGPTTSVSPTKTQTGIPDLPSTTNQDPNKQKLQAQFLLINDYLRNLSKNPLMPTDIKAVIDKYINQISQDIKTTPAAQMNSEKIQDMINKGKMIVPQELITTLKLPPFPVLDTKFKA